MAYDKNKVGEVAFIQQPTTGQENATTTLTFNLTYLEYAHEWEQNYACYKGVEGIVKANLIGKHPRESEENWQYRKGQLCSPNYTSGVVDTYTAHLNRKQGMVHKGSLKDNELFDLFLEDCDYSNTPFLDLFREEETYASIFGGVGYLVDMPAFDKSSNMSMAEAIKNKIYPYVSAYYPPNILDWQYIRDEWGRPVLVYLKLLDDDGFVRVWWDLGDKIHWEVYQSNISVLTTSVGPNSTFALSTMRIMTGTPKKISEGETDRIKYIPFEFQYNRQTGIRLIGQSDVNNISRLDVRIVNNLSRIGEIADIAAFPIMLVPKEREGNVPAEIPVGPTAVLGKDPITNFGPEWLAAQVAEPINALWMDNEKTREEIYRTALFGGADAEQTGTQSGVAIQMKYQMLGSRLAEKSRGISQAGCGILYHWASWLGIEAEEMPTLEMPTDYKIEDLVADLDAAVKACDFVQSDAFRREERRVIVNKMLPNLPEDVQQEIDDEIEEEFEIEEAEEDIPLDEQGNPIQDGVANSAQVGTGAPPIGPEDNEQKAHKK